MVRNRIRRRTFTFVAIMLIFAGGGAALAGDSFSEALKNGKLLLDIRYRYEFVDDAGFMEDARASTLRTRLGYVTGAFHGLTFLGELEDIHTVGADEYNSASNGLTMFPVVADPEGAELNQDYVAYGAVPHTTFRVGRQRITLDNHRFIGNVGWRQNEQTFDALSARYTPVEKLSLFYAHLENANTIYGADHPSLGNRNLNADLLNASWKFKIGTLTGYAYLLELEDTPLASHQDLGLRFKGQHAFSDKVRLLYTIEYADQSDYKDAPSTVDAGYAFAEAGLGIGWFTIRAGYEILEGDGVYAFQTPLATGHAFNGWADRFLATPVTGIEDTSLTAVAILAGIKLQAVYHDFSADEGGAEYGTEIDLLITRTFNKMYTAGLKYANYSADSATPILPGVPGVAGNNTDIEKIWAWLQLKF